MNSRIEFIGSIVGATGIFLSFINVFLAIPSLLVAAGCFGYLAYRQFISSREGARD